MVNTFSTDCPICGGIHFLYPVKDGKPDYTTVIPCKCAEKERVASLLQSCQLPPLAEKMTFQNFKPYTLLKEAFEESKGMATHPGILKWLCFLGVNGTGKTHLAVAIVKAWLEAGIPSRYVFTPLLLDELRQGFQHDGEINSYEKRFSYYCNIPLLLLDDYGAQSATPWVQEKLDTIVDYRLMNNKSLIVTTNTTLDDMPARIRSRLMRHPQGKIVAILAEDYALTKGSKR